MVLVSAFGPHLDVFLDHLLGGHVAEQHVLGILGRERELVRDAARLGGLLRVRVRVRLRVRVRVRVRGRVRVGLRLRVVELRGAG